MHKTLPWLPRGRKQRASAAADPRRTMLSRSCACRRHQLCTEERDFGTSPLLAELNQARLIACRRYHVSDHCI